MSTFSYFLRNLEFPPADQICQGASAHKYLCSPTLPCFPQQGQLFVLEVWFLNLLGASGDFSIARVPFGWTPGGGPAGADQELVPPICTGQSRKHLVPHPFQTRFLLSSQSLPNLVRLRDHCLSSVKYKVITNQFHEKPILSETTFIKNHFHQKTISLKTSFITNNFHQKPFSSKTNFIKNQFHQRPLLIRGTHNPSENSIVRVCVKVAGRRPATPSHKHGLCPAFRVSTGLHVKRKAGV